MSEYSLVEFAGLLTRMAVMIPAVNHAALTHGAIIIQKEAKRVIGTYDYGWAELAPSTKADRVNQGYNENEPGLRSGEMRDSIEYTVGVREAEIGSNEDKLLWFELGTSRQPARPVLMGAAEHKGSEVAEEIGLVFHHYLSTGGELLQKLP